MNDHNAKYLAANPRLGAVDFELVRKNGIFYADKTELLHDLIIDGSPVFLARPRRFGKTLLVSTLEHILLGHEELFEGLWIQGAGHDWKPRPVIKLNMRSAAKDTIEDMNSKLVTLLDKIAKREGLVIPTSNADDAFTELIEELKAKRGQNVDVLIDEYDAPITEHIADPSKAEAFRLALKGFYGVLKDQADNRGLVLMTGVSRFAKTSVFSELNDLYDLTYDDSCAEICGFTEADLDALLDRHQAGVIPKFVESGAMAPGSDREELRSLLLEWYDGYSFNGRTRVLNPWSTLSCLVEGEFREFWYETGTPSFLKEILEGDERSFDFSQEIEPVTAKDLVIDDVAKVKTTVLMVQTGYLTFKEAFGAQRGGKKYTLRVPNLEVQSAILSLQYPIKPPERLVLAKRWARLTLESLRKMDKPEFQRAFSHFLNQTTYEDHIPLEAHYRTQFKMAMFLADQPVKAQEQTGTGRMDLSLAGPERVDFIIELKHFKEAKKKGAKKKDAKKDEDPALLHEPMSKLAMEAMDRIERDYVPDFEGRGARLVKVAVVVARRTTVLAEFEEAWPDPV